jgi:hypothetical protein
MARGQLRFLREPRDGRVREYAALATGYRHVPSAAADAWDKRATSWWCSRPALWGMLAARAQYRFAAWVRQELRCAARRTWVSRPVSGRRGNRRLYTLDFATDDDRCASPESL